MCVCAVCANVCEVASLPVIWSVCVSHHSLPLHFHCELVYVCVCSNWWKSGYGGDSYVCVPRDTQCPRRDDGSLLDEKEGRGAWRELEKGGLKSGSYREL